MPSYMRMPEVDGDVTESASNKDGTSNTFVRGGGGEDSFGLWQVNLEPAPADRDSFDCAELVHWAAASPSASGTDVSTETITINHEGFELA